MDKRTCCPTCPLAGDLEWADPRVEAAARRYALSGMEPWDTFDPSTRYVRQTRMRDALGEFATHCSTPCSAPPAPTQGDIPIRFAVGQQVIVRRTALAEGTKATIVEVTDTLVRAAENSDGSIVHTFDARTGWGQEGADGTQRVDTPQGWDQFYRDATATHQLVLALRNCAQTLGRTAQLLDHDTAQALREQIEAAMGAVRANDVPTDRAGQAPKNSQKGHPLHP